MPGQSTVSIKRLARWGIILEPMPTLDVLWNCGGTPSFTRGEASSIVNLTFANSNPTRESCSWKVLSIHTPSDHCAIVWEIPTGRKTVGTCKMVNKIYWKTSIFDLVTFPWSRMIVQLPAIMLLWRQTIAWKESQVSAMEVCLQKSSTNRLQSVYRWKDHVATVRKESLSARRSEQRGLKSPSYDDLKAMHTKSSQGVNKFIKGNNR